MKYFATIFFLVGFFTGGLTVDERIIFEGSAKPSVYREMFNGDLVQLENFIQSQARKNLVTWPGQSSSDLQLYTCRLSYKSQLNNSDIIPDCRAHPMTGILEFPYSNAAPMAIEFLSCTCNHSDSERETQLYVTKVLSSDFAETLISINIFLTPSNNNKYVVSSGWEIRTEIIPNK